MSDRSQRSFSPVFYRGNKDAIEHIFSGLRNRRRVAIRYDRLAPKFPLGI